MRKYLFLSYMLIAVIVGLSVTLIIEQKLKEEIIARTVSNIAQISKQTVSKIDYSLDRRINEIENISYLPELQDIKNEHIDSLLNLLKNTIPDYLWLSYTSVPSGVILHTTSNFALGKFVGDKPWFDHSSKGYEFLGNIREPLLLKKYFPDKYKETKVIDLALPIKNKNNEVIATISAGLDLYWLQDILNRINETSTGDLPAKVIISNVDGLVLAGPDELIGTSITEDAVAKNDDGSENFVNSQQIKHVNLNWSVITYTPKHVAYKDITAANDELIKISILFFFIALILSHFLAATFIKPIKMLQMKIKDAIETPDDVRIPTTYSYEELVLLATAFNDLVLAVKDNKLQMEYLEHTLKKKPIDNSNN